MSLVVELFDEILRQVLERDRPFLMRAYSIAREEARKNPDSRTPIRALDYLPMARLLVAAHEEFESGMSVFQPVKPKRYVTLGELLGSVLAEIYGKQQNDGH